MIDVKQSNIHGYGVFSKQFINKGDIITYYDGIIKPNISLKNVPSMFANKHFSDFDAFFIYTHLDYTREHFENYNEIAFLKNLRSIAVDPNYSSEKLIYGYKYNELVDMNKVGSLINDGLWNGNLQEYVDAHKRLYERFGKTDPLGVFDDNGFLLISHDYPQINCCFKSDCVPRGLTINLYTNNVSQYAIIATRDIEPNEEITMTYGSFHWNNYLRYEHYMHYMNHVFSLANKHDLHINEFIEQYNEYIKGSYDHGEFRQFRINSKSMLDKYWLNELCGQTKNN